MAWPAGSRREPGATTPGAASMSGGGRKWQQNTREAPVVSDACEGIYEEIDALPEIYRSAFVLCYLEGLSHEQAASWLRCPLRTFQSRLLRAKERLRERLARRGASLPAVLPPLANSSSPSAAWVKTTAEAARAFAAGQAPFATAGVSAATISLARSSLRAAVHVPRLIAGALLTAGLAVLVVAVARGGFGTDPPLAPLQASEPQVVAQPEKDPNNRTLVLRVVNRNSRAPIEGAEVTVEIDSGARPGLGGEPELMTRLATDTGRTVQDRVPTSLAQGDIHHGSQGRLRRPGIRALA